MASIHRIAVASILLLAIAGSGHEHLAADAARDVYAAAFSTVAHDGGGGLVDCWNAMAELRSCTDEIVLFFLNGETTRIGAGCCRAVSTVTRDCWPAMLAAVGFTAEQADILRGLCDAEAAADSTLPPSPAPAAA